VKVYAVVYGDYDPPGVRALYDNQAAAEAHAATWDHTDPDSHPYEVWEMTVRSEYRP
jgi:hypothetical protein